MNKPPFKDVLGAVERYNPHLRCTTWMSIFSFCLVKRLFTINYGSSGDGKSFSTVELAKMMRAYDSSRVQDDGRLTCPVVIAPNRSTDRSFFDFLKMHSDQCVIIDDVSSLSKIQIGFLKEAMGEIGEVEYTTSRDRERNRFEFKGSIIINTNYEKQDSAIATRAYINYIYFDPQILKEKREHARRYDINKDAQVWNWIIKTINDRIEDHVNNDVELPELTDAEKDLAYSAVDEIDVGFFSNSSMRDDFKAMKLVQLFKMFFGSISVHMHDEIKLIIKQYIGAGILDSSQSTKNVIRQYMDLYSVSNIRKKELLKIMHAKYPNHDTEYWVDEALNKKVIIEAANADYITLAGVKSKVEQIAI
jgi:hypothetical protein